MQQTTLKQLQNTLEAEQRTPRESLAAEVDSWSVVAACDLRVARPLAQSSPRPPEFSPCPCPALPLPLRIRIRIRIAIPGPARGALISMTN